MEDWQKINDEVHSERYQNEFSDRRFTIVSEIMEQCKIKAEVGNW